ncbi:unnamed protein product [Notodromas monacha]|uniref:Uncharacterized protein n=1 Tax=Notodromas monacha TaxID=399045 RepID=A0A7R9BQ06_9CRUS|nr:unnamed protein product [Notodromas monacha]CAG0918199.1 unnamed protein product [Notodromas monacha]
MVSAKLSESWKQFAESTTLGGVGKINQTTSRPARIIWILIFALLCVITVKNTSEVLIDYFSFPVITDVEYKYQGGVAFPTVTICNRNPIPCSKLAAAYLKYPEELVRVMLLSGCKPSVSKPPLIFKMIRKEGEVIHSWITGWNATIFEAIANQDFTTLRINDNQTCLKNLLEESERIEVPKNIRNDSKRTFRILRALFTLCRPNLEDVLFPHLATIANFPSEPKLSANTSKNVPILQPVPPSPKGAEMTRQTLISALTSLYKNKNNRTIFEDLVYNFDEMIMDCTFAAGPCLVSAFTTDYHVAQGVCYTFNRVKNLQSLGKDAERVSTQTGISSGLTMNLKFDTNEHMPGLVTTGTGGRIAITQPGVLPLMLEEGRFVQLNTETDFALKIFSVTRLEAPYVSDCWNTWNRSDFSQFIYTNATSVDTFPLNIYSHRNCMAMCTNVFLIQDCNCSDSYLVQPFFYKGEEVGLGVRSCSGFQVQKEGDLTNPSANRENENSTARDVARVNIYFESLYGEEVNENAMYNVYQALSNVGGATGLYLGICWITVLEVTHFLAIVIRDTISWFMENRRNEQAWGNLPRKQHGISPAFQ